MYINVMAQQKGTDGSDTGKEMFIGKTKVVKNNHRPVFNETFKYQRDQASPYTIGTDGLLRIHLYDQMPGLMTADQDLGYFDIPLGAIVEDEKSGVEMMGQMELGQSKSHVAYKVDYKIDPIGTREDGGGIDDDFVFGNDPVVKKSSKG